jgi:hypothetical protein
MLLIKEGVIPSDKRQRRAAAKPRYPAASLEARDPSTAQLFRAVSSFPASERFLLFLIQS